MSDDELWARYSVQQLDLLMVIHLRITRRDGGDGIPWDDLQVMKRLAGYGDDYAIEVYPADRDIVNDANIRHLWVLPYPAFLLRVDNLFDAPTYPADALESLRSDGNA